MLESRLLFTLERRAVARRALGSLDLRSGLGGEWMHVSVCTVYSFLICS